MNYPKRFTIGLKSALLLSTVGMVIPAIAQEQDDDVIVVTGQPIRDSQAAAIAAKREADNVLDIIAADTIGRFPDQNLADSLGRLPGLAIERDQGQARYINFRGAPFRYTAIAFDGIDVPGAENGRIPRFDSFPSVIVSSVEANKAITPDLPGEAVAGFVNIKTFNPFDKEGFGLSAELGYGEQELGGGVINKVNARASWSNDKFGISAFGSTNYREQVTDNREYGITLDANNQPLIEDVDFRSYIVEREDNAYGGRIEYRPEGVVERVFLSTLYTEFVDNEERNQFVFTFQDSAGEDAPVDVGASGTGLLGVDLLLQDGQYDNSTNTTTLGTDWAMGEWAVEGRLNHTKTENNIFLPILRAFSAAAGTYDLTNAEDPSLQLFSISDASDLFTDPSSVTGIGAADLPYFGNIGLFFASALDNDAYKLKLDATRDLELFGRDSVVKTGFQYDTREAEGYDFVLNLDFAGLPTDVLDDPSNLANVYQSDVPWFTNFDNSIGANYFFNEDLFGNWKRSLGGFDIDVDGDQVVSIEEDIIAAYAMATTDFNWGNIVYGVRVEMTDYTSNGPDIDVAFSDDFVHVLPSLHFNFDLQEDVKIRLSATTGVSRPTYNEWRASAALNVADQTASGGNPTLDPETSWGGDISLEWYFADASLFSVGAFYRSIDDVIYAGNTTVDGGIYLESEAGQDWTLTGFENGTDGKLLGVEARFTGYAKDLLPSPFDGLGIDANITLLDSSFETVGANPRNLSLPGTSDIVYNASVFYEKYGLSTRVNYQYRDAWLSETEAAGLDEFWDEQERVDVSIRYAIPAEPYGVGFTLFANGNNLTESVDVRYQGTRTTPNQIEQYGSRWLFGLRADY